MEKQQTKNDPRAEKKKVLGKVKLRKKADNKLLPQQTTGNILIPIQCCNRSIIILSYQNFPIITLFQFSKISISKLHNVHKPNILRRRRCIINGVF
jgi:hypothetical protein